MKRDKIELPINGSVKRVSETMGLFDDMWVGKKLSFILESEYPIQEVELQGYLSNEFREGNSFTFKVGKDSKQFNSTPAEPFNCSIPVALPAYQKTKIELIAEKVLNPKQQGLGEDARDLGFLLIGLNLKRGKTAAEYLQEGKKLEKEGKLEAAIGFYQEAISLNPKFSWCYYKLAEALVKQGKEREAIAYYYQALELNPNSALFIYNLAEVLEKNGEGELAVFYLEKVSKIDQNFAELSGLKKIETILKNDVSPLEVMA